MDPDFLKIDSIEQVIRETEEKKRLNVFVEKGRFFFVKIFIFYRETVAVKNSSSVRKKGGKLFPPFQLASLPVITSPLSLSS